MVIKCFFSGSIRGGRDDVKLYHEIIQYLQSYCTVLTDHVGQTGVDVSEGMEVKGKSKL